MSSSRWVLVFPALGTGPGTKWRPPEAGRRKGKRERGEGSGTTPFPQETRDGTLGRTAHGRLQPLPTLASVGPPSPVRSQVLPPPHRGTSETSRSAALLSDEKVEPRTKSCTYRCLSLTVRDRLPAAGGDSPTPHPVPHLDFRTNPVLRLWTGLHSGRGEAVLLKPQFGRSGQQAGQARARRRGQRGRSPEAGRRAGNRLALAPVGHRHR